LFAERLRQSVNWEWRIAIHFAETVGICIFRRVNELFVRFEFCGDAEDFCFVHNAFAFAGSATNSRDSEIEIMGKKRMNKKRSVRKSPTLPKRVAQSQSVGAYLPHEEGM